MTNSRLETLTHRRIKKAMPRGMFALTLIIALGMFASSGWADKKSGMYSHDPASKLEYLTKKLSLTEEQQTKILPILEEKHKKMKSLHQKMKDVRKQTSGKIEAELTPEQAKNFQKMREERKKKMKEYREKHGKGDGKGKHDKENDHD